MPGSWIAFTTPSGGMLLFCEESGATLEAGEGGGYLTGPGAAGPCRLTTGAGVSHEVIGDVEALALALGARSVP